MGRIQRFTPPTYEQAAFEYYYSPEKRALYRKFFSPEFNMRLMDDKTNLLEQWPQTLPINGHYWPFLKVVFLMVHKRWPRAQVYYAHSPCNPALISEGIRPIS
jgi:hypothetical protein